MDGIALPLALTAIFVVINGFFVAAEFALVKTSPTRVANLAAKGNKRAKRLMGILEQLDLYLSGCQLGITVASLVLGALAEPAIARLIDLGVHAIGLSINPSVLHAISFGIALVVVTMLHMIFGEQAPKIWAIHSGEKMALVFSFPLWLFVSVLKPLIWVINHLSNAVLRLVGIRSGLEEETTHDIAEIRAILARSAGAGYLTTRQGEFAKNILDLVDLQVRHILVPRVDVVELSLKRSHEENLKIIRESGHSRFPLCRTDLDEVVGIVHAKDVLANMIEGGDANLEELSRPALFVPETKPVSLLIVELQSSHSGCAVVVDEHGITLGLVHLEDALEEIVGPIRDEFDHDELSKVETPSPGVFLLPGELPLPEARELLGLDELRGPDTIGGYVVTLLKRLPRKGDEVSIGSYKVTVEDVARRRVIGVRFVSETTPDEKKGKAENEEA